MLPLFSSLNLQNADAVCDALAAGAAANRTARCRHGSIDVISAADFPGASLIATGDLHDNPIHFARAVSLANMSGDADAAAPPHHLTLHELIHSDRLVNGVDLSYSALVRAAAVKAAFPERCHLLLANHELAQIVGAGIVKDGANVCALFNEGVEWVFGSDAPRVQAAIGDFIRSMPLGLRIQHAQTEGGGPDTLCTHSLPDPLLMDRFDPGVLSRDLTEDDYIPRRGSAHLLVWGRSQKPEQLESLARAWNIGLFVLGHEKAPDGAMLVGPNAVVINSDHERGCYIPLPLDTALSPADALARARRFASEDPTG